MKKKVGFVYFDDIHHIHHFIGVAAELCKNPNVHVDIITYQANHKYFYSLIKLLDITDISVVKLTTNKYRRIIDLVRANKRPSPLFLTKHNIKTILDYDAVVFTDYISCSIPNKRNTKFIYLSHGSGDRAYGYNIFKLKMFDLLLLAGNKIVDRIKSIDSTVNNYKIIGYPKFDVALKEINQTKLFNNQNKTVLYNPHNKKHLSSWYKDGKTILDFFLNNPTYNLIFAPHINLFNHKKYLDKNSFDTKYYHAANIHIDLGSERCSNMYYTFNADIYLGDVSSQVYEFLYNKKPCIFMNSHCAKWVGDENYAHWNLGKVIESPEQLKVTLDSINTLQKEYLKTQEDFFKYTFHIDESSKATTKGAKEILNLLFN